MDCPSSPTTRHNFGHSQVPAKPKPSCCESSRPSQSHEIKDPTICCNSNKARPFPAIAFKHSFTSGQASIGTTPSQTGPIDPGTAPLDTLQLDTLQLEIQQLDTKLLRSWPLAIAALALGLLGDLLLFQPGLGLGTTLFLLLLPATFGGLLKLHGLRPHVKSLWALQGAYGFFATMLSVRASVFLTTLNGLACLLLLGLLAQLALPEQIFETLWRLNRAGFVAWLALGGLSLALTVKPFALKRQSEDVRPPRLWGACHGLPADPPPGLRPLSSEPKI